MKALAVIALTVLAAVAMAWRPGGEEPAAALGVRGFTQVALADCSEWRGARIGERLRLLTDIADHFGHPSNAWSGATLPMDEARRVLEATCAAPQMRRVKLYKVYARALSFRPRER